jgi:hypothetical protein
MTGPFKVFDGGNFVVYGNGGIEEFAYGEQGYRAPRKIREQLHAVGLVPEDYKAGVSARVVVRANNVLKARTAAQVLLEKLADERDRENDEAFRERYAAFQKAIKTEPKITRTNVGKIAVFGSVESVFEK